jgi:hypothetical protein
VHIYYYCYYTTLRISNEICFFDFIPRTFNFLLTCLFQARIVSGLTCLFQESQWACFCVSGYRFCLLLPFLLGFGNVPTVWYILFFNLKLLFSGVCSCLFQNCITHVDRILLCNSID